MMNNDTNILKLLRPKAMTCYLDEDATLRQAIEKMKHHGFTAVPVINSRGEYVKTIAEGDYLWFLLSHDMAELERHHVSELRKRVSCEPVSVNSTLEDLFMLSMNQNFVPVVDDRGVFIGIVTRRDILQACYDRLKDSDFFDVEPEYEREEKE